MKKQHISSSYPAKEYLDISPIEAGSSLEWDLEGFPNEYEMILARSKEERLRNVSPVEYAECEPIEYIEAEPVRGGVAYVILFKLILFIAFVVFVSMYLKYIIISVLLLVLAFVLTQMAQMEKPVRGKHSTYKRKPNVDVKTNVDVRDGNVNVTTNVNVR